MNGGQYETREFFLLPISSQTLRELAQRAEFGFLADDQEWFASLSGFPGAWAMGKSTEEARVELMSVLHEWVSLRVFRGQPLPEVEGLDLAAAVGL